MWLSIACVKRETEREREINPIATASIQSSAVVVCGIDLLFSHLVIVVRVLLYVSVAGNSHCVLDWSSLQPMW